MVAPWVAARREEVVQADSVQSRRIPWHVFSLENAAGEDRIPANCRPAQERGGVDERKDRAGVGWQGMSLAVSMGIDCDMV